MKFQSGRYAQDNEDMEISADRLARWCARFIDSLLSISCAVPVFIFLQSQDVLLNPDMRLLFPLALCGAVLPINLYQWSLLSRTGQSLGKKWLKLRVVKVDGSQVDFLSAVVLRELVPFGIQLIPFIGSVINMIGILMIFGKERRCLHDRLAGTKVVQVLRSA